MFNDYFWSHSQACKLTNGRLFNLWNMSTVRTWMNTYIDISTNRNKKNKFKIIPTSDWPIYRRRQRYGTRYLKQITFAYREKNSMEIVMYKTRYYRNANTSIKSGVRLYVGQRRTCQPRAHLRHAPTYLSPHRQRIVDESSSIPCPSSSSATIITIIIIITMWE